MNLAIRCIEANLGPEHGDSFHRDLHGDLKADYVLANGSMASNTSGEGEIRKGIIEADLVDCMVALPGPKKSPISSPTRSKIQNSAPSRKGGVQELSGMNSTSRWGNLLQAIPTMNWVKACHSTKAGQISASVILHVGWSIAPPRSDWQMQAIRS